VKKNWKNAIGELRIFPFKKIEKILQSRLEPQFWRRHLLPQAESVCAARTRMKPGETRTPSTSVLAPAQDRRLAVWNPFFIIKEGALESLKWKKFLQRRHVGNDNISPQSHDFFFSFPLVFLFPYDPESDRSQFSFFLPAHYRISSPPVKMTSSSNQWRYHLSIIRPLTSSDLGAALIFF